MGSTRGSWNIEGNRLSMYYCIIYYFNQPPILTKLGDNLSRGLFLVFIFSLGCHRFPLGRISTSTGKYRGRMKGVNCAHARIVNNSMSFSIRREKD